MSTLPPVINVDKWIEENRSLLRPPVNNRQMALGEDFIVQVVGGPNRRTDYHVEPYEEWFHQLRGDMHINVMIDDRPRTVHVREGESWLLPANVPHSPQRPDPDSVGLVIERVRREGVLERFRWYCPACGAVTHEIELHVGDIVADLPPVFAEFYANEAARTCLRCGTRHPGKG